ncbi:MAG: SUMF1/EgtB/PvdO family nonheme iron enzyme [Chloroflexi bacterium]|nr:SUMF1/EgtB/PvdO family nonheme iron enzyme [Chloroflexota bacterium]
MDHYAILDVPHNASPEQIKASYRILVQLFHPDRLQHVSPAVRQYAEERLKKINTAYSVLSNAEKRAKYDAENGASPASAGRQGKSARTAQRERGPEPAYSYYTRPNDDVEDWLRQESEWREFQEAEARQHRAKREEEQKRKEAEERAKRAAAANFPRVRPQENSLVLQFAPGLWTTLVRVPAGEFIMGSDPAHDTSAREDELPQHAVYLAEYYIGKYPITNAQYQVFMEATHPRKLGETHRWQSPPGKENHPVVSVTWDEAAAFCMWLSQETGYIFRLPTEAEWEKAARGTDGRTFPWGEGWDFNRANALEMRPSATPVGQFSPDGDSPYGAADMSGNVWEWCADRYNGKEYQSRKRRVVKNPHGPEDGEGCVVRGGAFDTSARHIRCAHRNWHYPFKRHHDVGFRIVA